MNDKELVDDLKKSISNSLEQINLYNEFMRDSCIKNDWDDYVCGEINSALKKLGSCLILLELWFKNEKDDENDDTK